MRGHTIIIVLTNVIVCYISHVWALPTDSVNVAYPNKMLPVIEDYGIENVIEMDEEEYINSRKRRDDTPDEGSEMELTDFVNTMKEHWSTWLGSLEKPETDSAKTRRSADGEEDKDNTDFMATMKDSWEKWLETVKKSQNIGNKERRSTDNATNTDYMQKFQEQWNKWIASVNKPQSDANKEKRSAEEESESSGTDFMASMKEHWEKWLESMQKNQQEATGGKRKRSTVIDSDADKVDFMSIMTEQYQKWISEMEKPKDEPTPVEKRSTDPNASDNNFLAQLQAIYDKLNSNNAEQPKEKRSLQNQYEKLINKNNFTILKP